MLHRKMRSWLLSKRPDSSRNDLYSCTRCDPRCLCKGEEEENKKKRRIVDKKSLAKRKKEGREGGGKYQHVILYEQN